MRKYNSTSIVEETALRRSGKKFWYTPTEKTKIIEVDDFPTLGKLAAIRFIEWLLLNPEGVISLPTGKTPEYFLKWVTYFLQNWNKAEARKELGAWGLDVKKKPRMNSFAFVQIDEFYPINPNHENSFAYYVKKFYFGGFGLDPKKALLMDAWKIGAPPEKDLGWVFPEGRVDLSLRHRKPSNEREGLQHKALCEMDQFAMEYEGRIEQLGGIGFCLGGIGPDGHIGFNIRSSDHFSTTRLTSINYETAAAAAVDLGGIEVSRNKAVITIGLKTITENDSATAIIIAAGEDKGKVVKDAVEREPSILYPATVLQKLPAARFYLTRGAAKQLIERRYESLESLPEIPYSSASRILIDIASMRGGELTSLTKSDLQKDRIGCLLLKKTTDWRKLEQRISSDLEKRIEKGLEEVEGLTFLHTSPHHDDVMLGYLPYLLHLVRKPENSHYFATMTSGFTSVSNSYLLSKLRDLEEFLQKELLSDVMAEQNYFSPDNMVARNRDIYSYLDGVANDSSHMQTEAEARRMLRNLIELTGEFETKSIRKETGDLKNYLMSAYPGEKDIPGIQKLKGMIREWEEELLWAHLGFNCSHISHLRLGFYTGDIFTPTPEWERDIEPVLSLLRKINPDVITVALDPEGTGPDTHYKVLQIISGAMRTFMKENPKKKLKVWGYRNVWHRFHPSEADISIPVSMNSLAIMKAAFHICFGSQKAASFPSYEYDGPFCNLAQKVMVEQYAVLKTCLGRDFFYASNVPRLRATRGLVFLKCMDPEEFLDEALLTRKFMEGGKEHSFFSPCADVKTVIKYEHCD